MSGILIRLAEPAERALLEDLQRRASLANAGDRDALLAHPDAIQVPPEQIEAGRVFIAASDGAMAGFAAVEARSDGQCELDGLFVDPAMQRRGIGRALVEYCCEFALRHGAAFLHVIGNPHAERFYLACGFEQVGTAQTQFGPGLLMRRALSLLHNGVDDRA